MTPNHTPRVLALATLALFLAPAVQAQALGSGWYGGASAGRSMATIDHDRISGGLARQGLSTTGIEDRDRDNGYKVFGGYQLTPPLHSKPACSTWASLATRRPQRLEEH